MPQSVTNTSYWLGSGSDSVYGYMPYYLDSSHSVSTRTEKKANIRSVEEYIEYGLKMVLDQL